MKTIRFAALALLLLPGLLAHSLAAQESGLTDAIVRIDGGPPTGVPQSALKIEVNGKQTPLTALQPINPSAVEIALLIDDGLRTSLGRQLDDIRTFVRGLPQGTEILVGYMQNGRVVSEGGYTADLEKAASGVRLPFGSPGISASPYITISDFVKRPPKEPAVYGEQSGPGHKARFILMLTNGVDPYNGSVSPLNQDSPYVDAAATDAQRAGVPLYSIYYPDAGIGGTAANFSGQSYLSEVAEKTGGESLYNGRITPVDLLPYLQQFQAAVKQSYMATFAVPENLDHKDLVSLRVRSNEKGIKVHAAQSTHPGTVFSGVASRSSSGL